MIETMESIDRQPRVQDQDRALSVSSLHALLRTCLEAASRAPSGDNLQPWRFEVDAQNGEIAVCIDESRDRSPMNAGQKMSRIACGAAVQNIILAATECGGSATVVHDPRSEVVARIRVRPGSGRVQLMQSIFDRSTHRGMYSGESLPQSVQAELAAATPQMDGVDTHWICEPERIGALAKLIGAADTLMFSNTAMRTAFFASVRFDRPVHEEVEEGLSLASLELSAAERLALPVAQRSPTALLRLFGVFRGMGAHARKLASSASGLCLITAPNASDSSCVTVGRAVQRAWLGLTGRGLVAQPMMSLLVLANAVDHDPAHTFDRPRTEQLLNTFRMEIKLDSRPMFLLRFGFSEPQSGRTGRRPVPEIPTL